MPLMILPLPIFKELNILTNFLRLAIFLIEMYDLMYICIYSLIPEKAFYGRKEGSSVLHAVLLFFLYLTIFVWIGIYWLDLRGFNLYWLAGFIIVMVLQMSINDRYFLRKTKQKELVEKYSSYKKWKWKLFGVLLILFIYCLFIISAMIVSDSRKQSSLSESKSQVSSIF